MPGFSPDLPNPYSSATRLIQDVAEKLLVSVESRAMDRSPAVQPTLFFDTSTKEETWATTLGMPTILEYRIPHAAPAPRVPLGRLVAARLGSLLFNTPMPGVT